MRLEHFKVVQIVSCLCEGMGVRATSRVIGCHKDTVLQVLETVGPKCEAFLDRTLRNLTVDHLQIDELWARVYCKQSNTHAEDMEAGDFYTFLALDAKSKLLVDHFTGKRSAWSTGRFIGSLAKRITGRVQITTDGWHAYPSCIARNFWGRTDYAMLQKMYKGDPWKDTERKYSPAPFIGIRIEPILGWPKPHGICTSHIERANLTVRTFNRRFTRLCLGYSKKAQNHRLAVALFVAHYNFCKAHAAHKLTPAHAHKLTDHKWTTQELIEQITAGQN